MLLTACIYTTKAVRLALLGVDRFVERHKLFQTEGGSHQARFVDGTEGPGELGVHVLHELHSSSPHSRPASEGLLPERETPVRGEREQLFGVRLVQIVSSE